MVRKEFVKRKLQLIAEDLGRLQFFQDHSLEEISGDFVKLAAVERLLERIVMRAIDINEHLISQLADAREERITRLTYRDTFLKLVGIGALPAEFAESIALSVGLRNILVHDYNDIDRKIVHSSIRSCLSDYQEYVDYVYDFLEKL